MQTIKAIPTFYKGYHFRSRLEARWAVFFDEMRWRWEYEKEGYSIDGQAYLPDFFLRRPCIEYPDAGFWLEVKGQSPTQLEISKLLNLSIHTKHSGYIVFGLPGENPILKTHKSGEHHVISYGHKRFWQKHKISDETFGLMCLCTQIEPRDIEVRNRAVQAARSARFEHGESGATFRG